LRALGYFLKTISSRNQKITLRRYEFEATSQDSNLRPANSGRAAAIYCLLTGLFDGGCKQSIGYVIRQLLFELWNSYLPQYRCSLGARRFAARFRHKRIAFFVHRQKQSRMFGFFIHHEK